MKAYLIAIAAIGLLAAGCKSKKEMSTKSNAKADSIVVLDNTIPPTNNIAAGEPNPATPNDSIRLNVSFYSPGSGINYLAARKLDAFLTKYESENPGAVTVYKSAWGREGEVDYCFKMNDKSKGDGFVKQVQDLLKGEDRINYKENTTCRKARF
ncbi:MAG: hypothetical protein M0D57_06380 [Sphingobacteriales bacterium JAD_PAG50586_3]|nr:MAG: hypothetical protein M0D57_06380 [Sphingobacteriales bacterium JAD_PAG50586_3]